MRLAVLALFLLFAAWAAPDALAAQDASAGGVQPSSVEFMDRFARIHVAVAAVRDKFQAALAEPRNKTRDMQGALRDSIRTGVARTLAAHGMTDEEFSRITRRVSADTAERRAFEAALARVGARRP